MDSYTQVSLLVRKMLRELISEDFRYQYKDGFKPSSDVIGTAKRAIEAVRRNSLISHGGNEGSGMRKAEDLASGEPMTHEQLKRMKAFFDNNLENFKSEKIAGKNINTSEIIQKWELWGGNAGMRWVNQQISSAQDTNQTSKKLRPSGTKNLMNPHNTRTHTANHFHP